MHTPPVYQLPTDNPNRLDRATREELRRAVLDCAEVELYTDDDATADAIARELNAAETELRDYVLDPGHRSPADGWDAAMVALGGAPCPCPACRTRRADYAEQDNADAYRARRAPRA